MHKGWRLWHELEAAERERADVAVWWCIIQRDTCRSSPSVCRAGINPHHYHHALPLRRAGWPSRPSCLASWQALLVSRPRPPSAADPPGRQLPRKTFCTAATVLSGNLRPAGGGRGRPKAGWGRQAACHAWHGRPLHGRQRDFLQPLALPQSSSPRCRRKPEPACGCPATCARAAAKHSGVKRQAHSSAPPPTAGSLSCANVRQRAQLLMTCAPLSPSTWQRGSIGGAGEAATACSRWHAASRVPPSAKSSPAGMNMRAASAGQQSRNTIIGNRFRGRTHDSAAGAAARAGADALLAAASGPGPTLDVCRAVALAPHRGDERGRHLRCPAGRMHRACRVGSAASAAGAAPQPCLQGRGPRTSEQPC